MYKPSKKDLPPIEFSFNVIDDDGRICKVDAVAKHLRRFQFSGLNDHLIGVVEEKADPSGKLNSKRAAIKLGKVLISLDGIDPEALEEVGGDLEKFCELAGNEEFAYQGWLGYFEALEGAYTKSGAQNGNGDSGGKE